MTAKPFVCVKCGNEKACTFFPGGKRRPAFCYQDIDGRMIVPDWLEVPDKKPLKSIFPFE